MQCFNRILVSSEILRKNTAKSIWLSKAKNKAVMRWTRQTRYFMGIIIANLLLTRILRIPHCCMAGRRSGRAPFWPLASGLWNTYGRFIVQSFCVNVRT